MELELIARYSTSFGLLTTNQAHVVDGVGSRRAGSFIAPPRDLRPRVHLSITSTRTLAGARRIEPCSKNEQWEAKPPARRLVNANKPFMESNRAPRAKGLARRGNTRTFRASPSLALPSAPPPPCPPRRRRLPAPMAGPAASDRAPELKQLTSAASGSRKRRRFLTPRSGRDPAAQTHLGHF